MIRLPEIQLSPQEQHLLAIWTATAAHARAFVAHAPTPSVLYLALLGHAAADLLWRANLRMAMRIALDIAQQRGEDADDLFQEGCLALREAIRRFDPSLGFQLSSFAYEWILREIRNTEPASAYWVSCSKHYRAVRQQIANDPASRLGQASSLALAHRVDAAVLEQLLASDSAYDEIEEANVEVLALISDERQELMRLRFGFDGRAWSQAELATHFRVSRSTISRWEKQALAQAREVLIGPDRGHPYRYAEPHPWVA